MARFNKKKKEETLTENLAGGEAFTESPKLELVSILLTSFVQNQFYRKADDTLKRLVELMPLAGWEFSAKAALFARNEYGMRSITHVVGGEVAKHVKKETWTKKFLTKLFKRPDDMSETLAYYVSNYGKRPIPNCLKKSIRKRIQRLDDHTLAKYKMEGRDIKMVDLINLTHPKNGSVDSLMKGTLKAAQTWEVEIGEAAKKAETEGQKEELKAEAWIKLLKEKKLLYFALLRNLRNLSSITSKEEIELIAEQLTNGTAIRKSLVMPHQIYMAIKIGEKEGWNKKILGALMKAMDMSVENIPDMEGSTLVASDISSSMTKAISSGFQGKSAEAPMNCLQAAATFAAAYGKRGADVIAFANEANFVTMRESDSVISNAERIINARLNDGTNFHAIFEKLEKKYDRIIIMSDMQGWVNYSAPTGSFRDYCKKVGCKPKIFSWDLAGYGTLQFPERNIFCLAGYSDKNFDMIKMLDEDRQALIKKIEAIEL